MQVCFLRWDVKKIDKLSYIFMYLAGIPYYFTKAVTFTFNKDTWTTQIQEIAQLPSDRATKLELSGQSASL